MRIVKFFLSFIAVLFGALIGNWVGERWRALDTGEEGHELAMFHTGENGQITLAVNPVFTNFLPAVLVGLVSRPAGWLSAFVVGVLAARFMGDEYEDKLEEYIAFLQPQKREEVSQV